MGDATLREILRGKRAHADPIACVDDLPAALAGQRVEGYPHSIAQIVGHMNYWMDYEIRRIEGQPTVYPRHAAESWPATPAPDGEAAWQVMVKSFGELLGRLDALADSGPEVLNRQVQGNDPAQEAATSSVHSVLWQTAAHNSYHIGQIALLRRCLGAWPPQRGGDTW